MKATGIVRAVRMLIVAISGCACCAPAMADQIIGVQYRAAARR